MSMKASVEDIFLNLPRADLPKKLRVGGVYHFLILGEEFEMPVGKSTTLYWENPDIKTGIRAAIVRYESYEFLTRGLSKATRVGICIEKFLN